MPVNENRIFYSHELSNEDYHKDSAIGSSGLKLFKEECPAIYYAFYIKPQGAKHRKISNIQLLGSHAHLALLEPELFKQQYAISPQYATVNKKTKNPKQVEMNRAHADYKVFATEAEMLGKKTITWSEYEACCEMTAHIMNDPLARASMSGVGQNECSFFVMDKVTGIMMKARPDRVVDLKGVCGYRYVIVDYKTSGISLNEESQNVLVRRNKRYWQAAFHKYVVEENTGIQIDAVLYLTQMSEYPYLVQCYEMPKEDIELGHDEIRNSLEGYTDYNGRYHKGFAECVKDGIWPGFPGGIIKYRRATNFQYN